MQQQEEETAIRANDMGGVLTEATIDNLHDLVEAKLGKLAVEKVRMVKVPDALIDTGATTLALPKRLIEQLGLTKQYEKRAVTAAGIQAINVYESARVEIMADWRRSIQLKCLKAIRF